MKRKSRFNSGQNCERVCRHESNAGKCPIEVSQMKTNQSKPRGWRQFSLKRGLGTFCSHISPADDTKISWGKQKFLQTKLGLTKNTCPCLQTYIEQLLNLQLFCLCSLFRSILTLTVISPSIIFSSNSAKIWETKSQKNLKSKTH